MKSVIFFLESEQIQCNGAKKTLWESKNKTAKE